MPFCHFIVVEESNIDRMSCLPPGALSLWEGGSKTVKSLFARWTWFRRMLFCLACTWARRHRTHRWEVALLVKIQKTLSKGKRRFLDLQLARWSRRSEHGVRFEWKALQDLDWRSIALGLFSRLALPGDGWCSEWHSNAINILNLYRKWGDIDPLLIQHGVASVAIEFKSHAMQTSPIELQNIDCHSFWPSTRVRSISLLFNYFLTGTDFTMIPSRLWKIRKVRHRSKLVKCSNQSGWSVVCRPLSRTHSRYRSSFSRLSDEQWTKRSVPQTRQIFFAEERAFLSCLCSLFEWHRRQQATIGIKWKENNAAKLPFVRALVFGESKPFSNQ